MNTALEAPKKQKPRVRAGTVAQNPLGKQIAEALREPAAAPATATVTAPAPAQAALSLVAPAADKSPATPPAADPAPVAAPSAPAPVAAKPPAEDDNLPHVWLQNILAQCRAHGSEGDRAFRLWLFAILKQQGVKPYLFEENIVVKLGEGGKTLFSSHVDTVHASGVCTGQRQKLAYDGNRGEILLDLDFMKSGFCLGADDGAGIYIMLMMIKHGVKGTYVFHVGEERGGIGSNALYDADKKRDFSFLKQFNRAVAFDRKGKVDVVIQQGGERCASDMAGNALANVLNAADSSFKMAVSYGGSFTDTKVYRHVIPECFNVACGYEGAHGPSESLDWVFLDKLAQACTRIDWDKLPVARDPQAAARAEEARRGQQAAAYQRHRPSTTGYGYATGFEDQDQEDESLFPRQAQQKPNYTQPKPQIMPTKPRTSVRPPSIMEEMGEYGYDDFAQFVEADSDQAVRVMCMMQAKIASLQKQVTMLEDFFA